MAKAGFFSRLSNIVRGFLSLFIRGLESGNPEAVYESAIEEQKERFQQLRSAAAGVVMLNKKLQKELEEKSRLLNEVNGQIRAAVQQGDDEVALALIQQKDDLEAEVERLKQEVAKTESEVERTKAGLTSFQSEIQKLHREKESMLARKADAEARLQVQDSLNGLSVDADMKALESVREDINRTVAKADMASELDDSDLANRMDQIKQQASTASAQLQLDELKKDLGKEKNKDLDTLPESDDSAPGPGKSL